MNLFSSDEFLDVIAHVFFPDRKTSIGYYELKGRTFRLLEVDGEPNWSQAFLDYHQPLTPEEIPDDVVIKEGLTFLTNGVWKRVDVATWDDAFVPSDSPKDLPPRLHPSGVPFRGAPVVDFRAFDDHDAYLKFLRSKSSLVKSDQRMQRRLAEIPGGFQFHANDEGDDVLPFCFETKSAQTLESFGVDLFGLPEHKELFHELRRRGMLMASTLRNEERILAAWLGVIHDGAWNGWVYVYNHSEEFRKLSVGRQLMYFVLRECHARGIPEFDFSIGEADYKSYFSTHVRVVGPIGEEPLAQRARKAARKSLREFIQSEVYPRAPWIETRAEDALQKIRSRRWDKTGKL